jgi:hypothetical protein
MILSVHQPNFFPWLPYFKKIQESDVFVILGNVQFARRQFQNRFFYKDRWNTMSVNSGLQSDLIVDKSYLKPIEDWTKIKRGLNEDNLNKFDSHIGHNLYQTNVSIIYSLLRELNISTPILEDSHIQNLNASERIIKLCKENGADTYLTGPSGKKYLDISLFQHYGISIQDFNYGEDEAISVLELL